MQEKSNRNVRKIDLKKRMVGTFVQSILITNMIIIFAGQLLLQLNVRGIADHRNDELAIMVQHILFRFNFMTFIIVVVLGLVLYSKVYRDIISRLNKLSEATVMVANGEYDFTLEESRWNDEIDDLGRDFDNMIKRLKTASEQRIHDEEENRQLISNITHDLKTPVTAIKGYADGILDGVADTDEKREKYLKTICSKSEELNRLLNELTYFTSINQSMIAYNFADIDIGNYFADAVEEWSIDLESNHILMKYENELPAGTRVVADNAQLRKVVNNIIANSVKYMDKKAGYISVTLKDVKEYAHIEITDNGCGISKDDLEHIFDRFFRTDKARTSATGGSGIGLAIVKKIIDDMNGHIWCESTLGEGTTMYIELPKAAIDN